MPRAQWRRQVAEIEMHVGIDQSRQDGHVAQVADFALAARSDRPPRSPAVDA